MSGPHFTLRTVNASELVADLLLVVSYAAVVAGTALLAPLGVTLIAAGVILAGAVLAASR